KLGLQSELPAVPSLALGAGEVTLLEMTRAFAAIAANADRVESYGIRNVRNGDQVLFARQKSQLQPASNPAARSAMHDVLASVVREGTARGARIGVPAEGKTGTSQSYKDAWFIGFTDDIVVGIWVGNDDNTPTRGVTGAICPRASGTNSSPKAPRLGPRRFGRNRASRRSRPLPQATSHRRRARASFAGFPLCRLRGSWKSRGASCRCLESRACAAARRASSPATSAVGKWHASRPAAAMRTGAAPEIRICPVSFYSMGAAARLRMRQRTCV